MCVSVCIYVLQCVFGDSRRSVWPEDVFSVIHISTVNSAGKRGKRRQKCKQDREKETKISMYPCSLSLCVIHGLQLRNTFQLSSPKPPFSISRCYSASATADSWSLSRPFSLACHYKEPFISLRGWTSRPKTHLACKKAKRGRSAAHFAVNWHGATIDYRTWQCLFQKNLSAVTSLALLQQGQRAQRETNQYNIECESGPRLMRGDRRREEKKEDVDTKGERKWDWKGKGERKTESENRDKNDRF